MSIKFFENTDFQITLRGELSWILVPLSIILYYKFVNLRPILMYHMVCIAIIGTIDSYLRLKNINNGKYTLMTAIFFHLILLIILIDFKKYGNPNTISFIILIIANLVIYLLPYWPYELKRNEIMYLYNIIYFILYIIQRSLI